MKFVHEHEVPPSYDDFEDDAREITLRTLVDFEIISADGKTVSVEALGSDGATGDIKRPLCIHGTLVEPIDSKWRAAISSLASTAPHVEPKSHDDVRSSVAAPLKRGVSGKADTSSIASGDDNVSLAESMVSESMYASENPYTASIQPFDRANLRVGDAVDGYCNKTFKWYGAKVVKVEGDQVRVHFLGWKDRHDEWIHRNSERLAAKGSSLALMFDEAKKLSNLVPWYEAERLYKKASQSLGPMPARERVKVYIEDVEDWCIDYTYANPTLWVISAAGVWYRIAGALVPGGASGSPKPHYAAVFHDTVTKFNCASHVVMCLLDFLPGRPKLDVDFVAEEVAARTNGKINCDLILSHHQFLVEQIQALAQPPEWHASINLTKCFFVQNLAKRGAALENGGKRKVADDSGADFGSSSSKRYKRSLPPPVYMEDYDDEVTRRAEVVRPKGPVTDEELTLMEAQRGVAVSPFPSPGKGRQLRCPASLQKVFLHAWATTMNFKMPLRVPYLSPEFLEECLYSGASASSSCNFIVKELHLALLSAILADRLRSGKALAVRVTPDSDLSDDELAAVNSLLVSNSWATAPDAGEGVLERKIKNFLGEGSTWVELARVLVAEQFEYALSEYRDPIGECAGILDAIIKDCANDAIYFLSMENFPAPSPDGLARDLNMVQARLRDGFYDEPRLFDLHLRFSAEGAHVGRLVDAYSEKSCVWHPARIVAHNARSASVTVHFMEFGNSSTYDEVIALSSGGLMEYCTVSIDGARRRLPPREVAAPAVSFGVSDGVSSSRQAARGHAGFAADVRAVLQEAPMRYRDKDIEIVNEAAKNVSDVFERLYEKNVLGHEAKAMQLEAARCSGKVAATSSNGYWASVVSIDELLRGLSQLTYHELSFECKLQLLNWLCDAYVNTSGCKSYIEELVELKHVQSRESKMKKKGDIDSSGKPLRLTMKSRRGSYDDDDDDDEEGGSDDDAVGVLISQQYDVARFPNLSELTARLLPAGSDRDGRNYWIFAQDRSPRIFCETSSARGSWSAFYGQEEVSELYLWLREKGLREGKLRKALAAWLTARGWEIPRKPTKASKKGDEDLDPFLLEEEELTPYKRNTRRCTETAQRKNRSAVNAERLKDAEKPVEEANREMLQLFVRPDKGVEAPPSARIASFTVSVDVGFYGQLGVGVKEVLDTVIVNSFKYTEGSPSAAENAGVRIGDRIIACNSTLVSRIADLQVVLKDINASDVKIAHLFILRRMPDAVINAAVEHDPEMRHAISQQSKKDVASAAAFAKICGDATGEISGKWITGYPYFEQGFIPGHLMATLLHLLSFTISVCIVPNTALSNSSGLQKKTSELLESLLLASFSKGIVASEERLSHIRPQQIQKASFLKNLKKADLIKPTEWLLSIKGMLPQLLLEMEEVLDLFKDIMHPSWYEGRRRFKWRKQCFAASNFAQLSLCVSVLHEAVQTEEVARRRVSMSRTKAIAQYTNAINQYGSKHKHKLPRPIREIPGEWSDVLYYGDGHAASLAFVPQGRSDVTVGDVAIAPVPGAIIPCQVAVTKVFITGDVDSPQTWTTYCQLDLCVLARINVSKYGLVDTPSAPEAVEPSADINRKRLNRIVLRTIAIVAHSRDSKPFEYPVDRQLYPDYYDTIEKPISFTEIKERAAADGYGTVEEVVQDVLLLRNNCRTFCEVDFPELVVAAEAIYAEASHLLTVTFAEEIRSGLSSVYDTVEAQSAAIKSKGGVISTPGTDSEQFRPGNRFTIVMSLDISAPLFVVPLKMYLPSLGGLSLERRFVVTSGEGDDEYESSGVIVGSKPIDDTGDVGTTFVPWNWLAVEWTDLDDIESDMHGFFINPWVIDRKKFDGDVKEDAIVGSSSDGKRSKYKHSEEFLKKREQNLKNNSSKYYRNLGDSYSTSS